MPFSRRSVLFQTMGRGAKKEEWEKITRPHVQRIPASGGWGDTGPEESTGYCGADARKIFEE